MSNHKRILKTGALAIAMTVVFVIFAFRAAEWTKGVSSEFIVYGQASGGSGSGGSTGSGLTKVVPQVVAGHFSDQVKYNTVIQIINSGSSTATVSGNFYNEDGTPSTVTMGTSLSTLPTFTGNFTNAPVPPNTSLIINVVPRLVGSSSASDTWSPACTRRNQTGNCNRWQSTTLWAKFTSSSPVTVASFFELRDSDLDLTYGRVGIPASPANMTTFVMPRIREKPAIETGLAIVNTGSSPASVTAILRDANGATLGVKNLRLNSNEHQVQIIGAMFGLSDAVETAGRQYQSITFTSNSPTIAAAALTFEGANLTSVPVDVVQ